ncbi:zinc ribbon domain-containing protein [Streptomyces sp. NPDC088785]|uniref:zinc ribbon domain-containing protein n=1 Tax=Streptomyces sp. NPDC088785 TaxID=3365897 RepID=UPI00380221EE
MMSFCPHCGAEAPVEARFCMRCGKERSPQFPPPATPTALDQPLPPVPATPPPPARPPADPPDTAPLPPPPLPPPARPPGRTGPSPLGAFFGRALRGDWAGAAQAALWPVGLLLIGAVALAVPGYGQRADADDFVGFGDRLRIALTALMHGLGGTFEVTAVDGGGSAPFDSASSGASASGSLDLFMPPLLVPVLWCVALLIGVRMLRTRVLLAQRPDASWAPPPARTLGPETAVRVGLLAMAGTVVLGLFGQPTVQQVAFHTAPFLVALCTLALGAGVTVAVFQRDDIARWLAVRPAVRAVSRALGSAVRAMAWVLPLVLVAAFVVGIVTDDGRGGGVDDTTDDATDGGAVAGIVLLALYLPNLALTGLGFVWGAPAEIDLRGTGLGGGRYEHDTYGLGQLRDDAGTGALIGVLAFGLALALLVGVLIARRSRDRRERYLGGGLFVVLLLVLGAVSGFSVRTSGGLTDGSALGRTGTGGLGLTELLLFGLLWVGGAVVVAPSLLRLAGLGRGPGGEEGGATAPPAADQAAATGAHELPPVGDLADAPTRTSSVLPPPPPGAHDPYAGRPVPPPPAPVRDAHGRASVWIATLLGAFVIGGGAVAGVLLLRDDGGADDAKDDLPVAARTDRPPSAAPPAPAPTPTAAPGSPTPSATAPAAAPAGYRQVVDPKGFTFAVPAAWSRTGVKNGSQITYSGGSDRERYLVGVIPMAPYTSYGNFLNLEKHLQADPKKTGYQRIRLEPNTFQGRSGALWEYTYRDGNGRTVHGIDQSYIAADGTEYAIFLTGADADWGTLGETYRIGLDSWRLTAPE